MKVRNDIFVKLSGTLQVLAEPQQRTSTINLQGDRAIAPLHNPNYADLGMAYIGASNGLYGDDLQVEVFLQ